MVAIVNKAAVDFIGQDEDISVANRFGNFENIFLRQDPAGWVWLNQQPLLIPHLQSETRWPNFVERARDVGLSSLVLVPLTTGNSRLGAFGFSSVSRFDPSPAEIAFLERVASEFAVAVEGCLAV